jgi:hypothetical protein
LNKARRDPKTVAEELRIGKAHMNFCIDVYRMQMRSGRHFAHEHPAGSTSWNMPEVKQFILEYGIESVKMNMCSFGMTSRDEEGIGLVAKPTRILSSSPEILKRVDRPCVADIGMFTSSQERQRLRKSTRGDSALPYVQELQHKGNSTISG